MSVQALNDKVMLIATQSQASLSERIETAIYSQSPLEELRKIRESRSSQTALQSLDAAESFLRDMPDSTRYSILCLCS